MRRFVLRQNIERFRELEALETDPREKAKLLAMLHSEQRQLALFEADEEGAWDGPAFGYMRRFCEPRSSEHEFRRHFEAVPQNFLLLDPGPGLHIVDVNDAYADSAMIKRDAVIGERLFDVFPENPDDPFADGVSNALASFQAVARTGRTQIVPTQRYDLRTPEGVFVARYWRAVSTPIFSDDGRLRYILNELEDVTAEVSLAEAPSMRLSDIA
jgi:PAS domain-containing protein